MSPKLSIIIPAYNVDPYLSACVESIMKNTFQDFEVILIDDGSTDHTGIICDELAGHYPNIVVFHTTNRGLSIARNLGLDHANGELIGFVDSDDLISPNMFQLLVDAFTSQDVQLSMCRFIRCNECDQIKTMPVYHVIPTIETQCQLAQKIMTGGYGQYVWNKLYRRDIIEKYHIRFPKDCKAIEDVYFVWDYVHHCMNAASIDTPLYYYIMHNSSIMNTFRNNRIVNDTYINLPRGWYHCSNVVSEIAPELVPEAVARTAMFYQTVLRKLDHPSQEYIHESQSYVRKHNISLCHFSWGWKYFLSGVILSISYPLWSCIFRKGIDR